MSWRRIPLYPLVLPATALLGAYAPLSNSLLVSELLWPWVLATALTGAALVCGRLLFGAGGWDKSAAVVAATGLHVFLGSAFGPRLEPLFVGAMLALTVALLFAPARAVQGTTFPANVLALGMLAISLFDAVSAQTETAELARRRDAPRPVFDRAAPAARGPADLPDLYLILLDGYGRADVLAQKYGFDNRLFLAQLRRRGFHVVPGSVANYAQTRLTFVSLSHLDYVQEVVEFRSPGQLDLTAFRRLVNDGPLFELLETAGYRIVTISSGLKDLELRRPGVVDASGFQIGSFAWSWLRGLSIVKGLEYLVPEVSSLPHRLHARRVTEGLASLSQLRDPERPTFVLAHFVSPHPPFVFDANGETTELATRFAYADGGDWRRLHGESAAAYQRGYVAQLRQLNSLVLRALDGILEDSPRPVAILLFSDHGPGSMLEWGSREATDVAERMPNLQAHYWPGGDYSALAKNTSLLSGVRLLVDQQLGTQLGATDDRAYFSLRHRPFDFYDVTDELPQLGLGLGRGQEHGQGARKAQ